jgi:NAD(P)-dependent dehydrogenase (short-subunit alcohol dehydrogenase family)
VLADKDLEDAEKLGKNLVDEGLEARTVRCDATYGQSITDLFDEITNVYRRLDALINNTGTHIPGSILETTERHWDFLLTLNLKSVFLCSKVAIPALRESRGAIVSLASMVGLAGQRNAVVYSASKGGIIALTKSLALDHAHEGIRVNCLCPGNVDTPMMQDWIGQQRNAEEVRARVYNAQPIGRLADPVEVGRAALFLATEPFITGVALPVEDGATPGY